MSNAPHVLGIFYVGIVEGFEKSGRNRTYTRHHQTAIVSGGRLRHVDTTGVEIQFAGALASGNKVSFLGTIMTPKKRARKFRILKKLLF